MIASTGSIYGIMCPHCGRTMNHLWKLTNMEPSTMVSCQRCGRQSFIERVWAQDGVWPRVTLTDTIPDPTEG